MDDFKEKFKDLGHFIKHCIRLADIPEERDRYVCKECGKEAGVSRDGKIKRSCEHNTTVVLQLNVIARGQSKVSGNVVRNKVIN